MRGWSVTLAGGQSTGGVTDVPHGREMLIGRSPHADLSLPTESASWDHCRLRREEDGLRVFDGGSTNGTLVNGEPVGEDGVLVTETATITAGGAVLLLRRSLDETPAPPPGSLHNLTPAATAPFNRPPRPGQTPAGEPLVPPSRKDVPPASKFSYITVLAPLVMAAAMVLILRDLRFAMFAMLSPVMGVGMWFEQKRRHARGLKEEDERFAGALQGFERQIREAAATETARRHRMIPDPATVVRRPALPATSLWQRRADADDFLALHAGTGDVPWKPEVDRTAGSRLDEKVKDSLAAARLQAAPVLVDLTDAGVVGIVGPREGTLALARSLLAQAAVHVGPADLTIGVFCDAGRADEWEWASWLPHTRQAGSSTGERWMSADREASLAMLRTLKDAVQELPTPAMLVVLDSEVLTEGRDSPARALLGTGRSVPGAHGSPQRRPSRVAGIVIATSEEQLPASCTTIIRVGSDAAATVDQPEDLTRVEDVILAGLDQEEALRCAMRVAHFDDPELSVPGASLPPLVRLPGLLGYDRPDSTTIRRMWQAPTGVSTPIGTGENGTLTLDLVKDGPHGLVGGTTGSGKSEFLRSLVAGLAARNDPTRLNFILVDFKGGAAFKACERLPHTIGTISNLDEQLADRALRALEATGVSFRVLFLDANDDVLVRRFEQGRRPHPLQGGGRILDGIAAERELVRELKDTADIVLDTSSLNVHGLATAITELFSETGPVALRLNVMSFGFKYGLPVDANFVADARFIPNPHWVPQLRPHTGLDKDVSDYVLEAQGVSDFVERYVLALEPVLDGYRRENKHYATIAVGCTGGKHRSVAVAVELSRRLAQYPRVTVTTTHRDLGRE
ncbi:Nucleotide-binding protein Rv1421 [Microbacterium sp. Bi128]|nr:Nucleotide-binding protein Rv1421 [Microbacterium sp. Bi128]